MTPEQAIPPNTTAISITREQRIMKVEIEMEQQRKGKGKKNYEKTRGKKSDYAMRKGKRTNTNC